MNGTQGAPRSAACWLLTGVMAISAGPVSASMGRPDFSLADYHHSLGPVDVPPVADAEQPQAPMRRSRRHAVIQHSAASVIAKPAATSPAQRDLAAGTTPHH